MCLANDVAQERVLRTLETNRNFSTRLLTLTMLRRERRAAGVKREVTGVDGEREVMRREELQDDGFTAKEARPEELPPDLLMDLDIPKARGVARLLASGCTDGEVMEMMGMSRKLFVSIRDYIAARLTSYRAA